MVELVCCGQSCGASTDDSRALAVAHRCYDVNIVFLESMLGDGRLVLTVCRRLVLGKVQYARFLAECRTYASRELREGVGGVEQLVCEFPVAFVQCVVPLWRFVAQWACPVAERYSAVHAA